MYSALGQRQPVKVIVDVIDGVGIPMDVGWADPILVQGEMDIFPLQLREYLAFGKEVF